MLTSARDGEPERLVVHVTLYRRGRVWWVRYRQAGIQLRRSLQTENRKLAEDRRAEIEYLLRRGELREDIPLPVQPTLERFLAEQDGRKTKRSAATDRCYLRRFFAAVPLQDLRALTTGMVGDYLADREKRDKLAPKTLNRIRQVLGTFYEWLLDRDLVRANPVRRVKCYRESAPEIRYLTLAQIDELFAAVREDLIYPVVATAIYAGLRRAELCWLRWEDVDFGRRVLSVRAKRSEDERWQTKTRRNRAVPISPKLDAILRGLPHSAEWVFPSPKGMRWDEDNLTSRVERVASAAGLSWTLLDCRHTFASQLAMRGVSLAKIAALLGNSPEICRRHYAHIATEDLHVDVAF